MQQKVTQALAELRINAARLVMPTPQNTAKLDELTEATALLLDLKKANDRLEYEISVAKEQLGITEGDGGGNGDAMDIDAESVSSVRNGQRNRKQVSDSVRVCTFCVHTFLSLGVQCPCHRSTLTPLDPLQERRSVRRGRDILYSRIVPCCWIIAEQRSL